MSSAADTGDIVSSLPVDVDVPPDTAAGTTSAQDLALILGIIGFAGVLGALWRYALGKIMPVAPHGFPWATFIVNISGSLALGFVLILLIENLPQVRLARPLVATGFLGSYTTFSTYMVETDLLFRDHRLGIGIAYALASVFGGTVAAFAGIGGGRWAVVLERRLRGEQLRAPQEAQ
jgi:CrcB protein